MRLPGITEEDKRDILEFGLKHNVDIISGSFVRHPSHVQEIRECLGQAGRRIRVHAKLETVALRNIQAIVEASDGIHVSRGDLGMELSLEKVCLAQKMAIHLANVHGKTVVTSTQMLDSMKRRPRPSSAECTDVANAVIDGSDALMLSGETASGIYPKKAVETMSRIIIEAERCLDYRHIFLDIRSEVLVRCGTVGPTEALASSAVETATSLSAKLLIVVSYSGDLVRLVAKYRPKARILLVTTSPTTARQCNSVWGATAVLINDQDLSNNTVLGDDRLFSVATLHAQQRGWVHALDCIVGVVSDKERKAVTPPAYCRLFIDLSTAQTQLRFFMRPH